MYIVFYFYRGPSVRTGKKKEKEKEKKEDVYCVRRNQQLVLPDAAWVPLAKGLLYPFLSNRGFSCLGVSQSSHVSLPSRRRGRAAASRPEGPPASVGHLIPGPGTRGGGGSAARILLRGLSRPLRPRPCPLRRPSPPVRRRNRSRGRCLFAQRLRDGGS